jgi:hypothetical protein
MEADQRFQSCPNDAVITAKRPVFEDA